MTDPRVDELIADGVLVDSGRTLCTYHTWLCHNPLDCDIVPLYRVRPRRPVAVQTDPVPSGWCKTCRHQDDVLAPDGDCMTCCVDAAERAAGIVKRYFIRAGDGPEREVDESEFVDTERQAGFYNTLGRPEKPATAGFSGRNLSGRIEYELPDAGAHHEPGTCRPSCSRECFKAKIGTVGVTLPPSFKAVR